MGAQSTLEIILKDSYDYNIDELSGLLNENNTSFLIRTLLNFLNTNITDTFIDDKKYLLNIFKYLNLLINNNEFLNKESISKKIRKIIINIENNLNTSENDPLILKDAINQLENLYISLTYDLKLIYSEDKFSLMKYIVFESNNYYMLKEIILKFPHLANICDDNKKSLISLVFKRYLIELNEYIDNNLKNNLIYYDHVLDILLSSKRLRLEELVDKVEILKDINKLLEKVENNLTLNGRKKEILHWIKTLKNSITSTTNKITEDKQLYLSERYGLTTEFSNEIIREYNKYLYIPPQNREIVTDLTIAIDPAKTRVFDDALNMKKLENGNYLISVHINEFMNNVTYNKIILSDVINRGKTFCVNQKRISVMPTQMENKVSLKPNMVRMCKSYYFEINGLGEVVNFYIKKNNLILDKCLINTQVNKIIASKTYNSPLEQLVFELHEVANLIMNRNPVNPFYVLYKEKEQKEFTYSSFAEEIVQTCMLLPNSYIALMSYENKTPYIYRNQVANANLKEDIRLLTSSFSESLDDHNLKKIVNSLINNFPSGYYSSVNKGHYGLGLKSYGTISAPTRRGGDAVNELCIDTCYFKTPTNKEVYELEELVKESVVILNDKIGCIDEFVRQYTKK